MNFRILNKCLFLSILFISVVGEFSNVFHLRKVMSLYSNAIENINIYIDENFTDRTNFILLSNTISMDDLRLHNKINNILFTHSAGHSRKVLNNKNEIDEYIFHNHKDVFLLITDFEYLDSKKGFHSHPFISKCNYESNKIFDLHYEFLLLDFMKYFIDRRFWNFYGPPDFQDDYYYGPGHILNYKTYANYYLVNYKECS